MPELKDYQIEGVKFLLSGRRKLLADDMGLGKTVMALSALNRVKGQKLLICPAAVVDSWVASVPTWAPRVKSVQVLKGLKSEASRLADLVICPSSILRSPMLVDSILKRQWAVTIIDECHMAKNAKANTTRVVFGLRNSIGLVHMSNRFWCLSGTPMTKSPIDLWPILRTCAGKRLGKYGKYSAYTRRYCQRYLDPVTGRENVKGASNVEELQKLIFDGSFGLRRDKRTVAKELPPKILRFLSFESREDPLITAWKGKIERNLVAGKWGADDLELLHELRHNAMQAKIGPVVEHVLQLLETKEKVVVFCWHRDAVKWLTDEFEFAGKKVAAYHGGVTSANKAKAKDDFIDGDSNIFLANITSAGTGLDGLQTVCSHAVFAEIPWNFAEIAQASDRIDRIGQKVTPIVDMCISKGSVDALVLNIVLAKHKSFKALLTDGDES